VALVSASFLSPDCSVAKHVDCGCFCHGETIAVPTAPGVTVIMADVSWECPNCHISGLGSQSLFGHATEHINQITSGVTITGAKIKEIVFSPGALSLAKQPDLGDELPQKGPL
jgi:hypothetical protein